MNAIGSKDFRNIAKSLDTLAPQSKSIRTTDERPMQCLGRLRLSLEVSGHKTDTTAFVFKGVSEALLSKKSLKKLEFLSEDFDDVKL